MRRTLPAAIIVVSGLVILADLLVANPGLEQLAGWLLELVVLLSAGAALLGGAALARRRVDDLLGRRTDRAGPVAVLTGLLVMLGLGLYPGSEGLAEPALGWLIAAVVVPLVSTLFALLFLFLLAAARRGVALRSRETSLMLAAAAVTVALLLPLDGPPGEWLAGAAGWTLAVPVAGVFRGLLIAVGVATAVAATRLLLGVDGADE